MSALVLAALALLPASPARAGAPADMSFDRFVFAAIWQPGVCASGDPVAAEACRDSKKPPEARWTLHGLWADLPTGLAREGVPKSEWYAHGCYRFHPGREPRSFCEDPALKLDKEVSRALDSEMPGRKGCLDRHEYYKHAECYGWKPSPFFRRALALLKKLNASKFAAYVASHRGETVARADLEKSFAAAFGLPSADALELRCSARPGAKVADVLTQAWFTLKAESADDFPAPKSFLAGRRATCADRVLIAR